MFWELLQYFIGLFLYTLIFFVLGGTFLLLGFLATKQLFFNKPQFKTDNRKKKVE
jgi:hypothetical protein